MKQLTPVDVFVTVLDENPGASETELFEKFSSVIAGNKELQSAIAREVFENLQVAHEDLDLSKFDMKSEILPMVKRWCDEQTRKLAAQPATRP